MNERGWRVLFDVYPAWAIFSVFGILTAHLVGFFGKFDASLTPFLDSQASIEVTYPIVFSALIGLVAYQLSPVLASIFESVFSLLLAKKRQINLPNKQHKIRIKKLEVIRQIHISSNFRKQNYSTIFKLLFAICVFVLVYLGPNMWSVLWFLFVSATLTGLLALPMLAETNPRSKKDFKRLIRDKRVPPLIVFFMICVSFSAGQTRFNYISSSGCVKIFLGNENTLTGSLVLKTNTGFFFVDQKKQNKIDFLPLPSISSIEGNSFQRQGSKILLRFPFIRSKCTLDH